MKNVEASSVYFLTRATGTLDGRKYEITSHKGGRRDLFVEYSDVPGLMEYVGKLGDVIPTIDPKYRLDPLVRAHSAAYLDRNGSVPSGW